MIVFGYMSPVLHMACLLLERHVLTCTLLSKETKTGRPVLQHCYLMWLVSSSLCMEKVVWLQWSFFICGVRSDYTTAAEGKTA